MYGKDGTITREGAEAAIKAGGTVLSPDGSTLYSKPEHLPDEFAPVAQSAPNPATAGATAQAVAGADETGNTGNTGGAKSLDKLTKAELVELGAKHGVTLSEDSKKDDLIAALEAAGVQPE